METDGRAAAPGGHEACMRERLLKAFAEADARIADMEKRGEADPITEMAAYAWAAREAMEEGAPESPAGKAAGPWRQAVRRRKEPCRRMDEEEFEEAFMRDCLPLVPERMAEAYERECAERDVPPDECFRLTRRARAGTDGGEPGGREPAWPFAAAMALVTAAAAAAFMR